MVNKYGRYVGAPPVVSWLDDGRLVKLMKSFAYINAKGQHWRVPKHAEVDGASIPRPLWSLIGGPFEGKYRNASIVHDWFCDVRTRAWQGVHRMFHEGLLASGVGPRRAMLMYAAVSRFGPRWSCTVVANSRLATKCRFAFCSASDRDAKVTFRNFSQMYGDQLLTKWVAMSSGVCVIPDDRRRSARGAAYTLPFDEADLEQLVRSVSTENLTLDHVDALVDAQALNGYQKTALLGQAARFRQPYF